MMVRDKRRIDRIQDSGRRIKGNFNGISILYLYTYNAIGYIVLYHSIGYILYTTIYYGIILYILVYYNILK